MVAEGRIELPPLGYEPNNLPLIYPAIWWSLGGSNPQLPAWEASVLVQLDEGTILINYKILLEKQYILHCKFLHIEFEYQNYP